jgi:hypothetical protein
MAIHIDEQPRVIPMPGCRCAICDARITALLAYTGKFVAEPCGCITHQHPRAYTGAPTHSQFSPISRRSA